MTSSGHRWILLEAPRKGLQLLPRIYRIMASYECPSRSATNVSLPQDPVCFLPIIARHSELLGRTYNCCLEDIES